MIKTEATKMAEIKKIFKKGVQTQIIISILGKSNVTS